MGISYRSGNTKREMMGKNAFSQMMKELAVEVGLDKPDRQTSASLRRECISTLYNADEVIDSKVIKTVSRHKSDAAHEVYKERSQKQLDKVTKAFHASKKLVSFILLLYSISFHFVFYFNTFVIIIITAKEGSEERKEEDEESEEIEKISRRRKRCNSRQCFAYK